jgi:predicted ATPase
MRREENVGRDDEFPFCLPWFANFDLQIDNPVTFFVGENGSGKSTQIEALAVLSGLPAGGGGRNEASNSNSPDDSSPLAPAMRPVFRKRPRDGFFFRAEFYAHFASLLDIRRQDPEFNGDPYSRYGGKSLHARSHGESFLELMQNRFQRGLFFLDEPESALSPQRQLTLLALICDRVKNGDAQFVIATHSPILLTYPGAVILSFDESPLAPIVLQDTSHYHITRGILEHPERYWRHLLDGSGE